MLITQRKELKKYETSYRIWQGIASIERTKKGRLFAAFYSSGVQEQVGNYCMLLKSDDDSYNWSEEFAIGNDIMLNRPTVLSDGSWLFPITVWNRNIFVVFQTKAEANKFI